ncbi:metal ABC transporter substrate-binding protein [Clostridiaceae bacterium 35-E11]
MQRRIWGFLSILMICSILWITGCTIQTHQKPQDKQVYKPVVYTTIYPMYDFTYQIGKDKIDLRKMIPPGAEPHDWEPTAKLMAELEKADVFIYNGVNMEPWVDKLLGAIQNEKLIVVEASQGIDLLTLQEHTHEESHDKEDHYGAYDPHVWLDPLNAIKQAETIKNALIKADESNQKFYETNFEVFADELKKLDKNFQERLRNIKRREVVVAHAAFGYMAKRYDLEQIAITGLSPQQEPSAVKMAEISDFVKNHQLKYIFFETLTSPRLAQVLAKETGARTEVLNPIGGLTEEEIKAGKNYISVMEENLSTLIKALGE